MAIERQAICETIVETLNELEEKRDRQVRELELRVAELSGAVGVLRRGRAILERREKIKRETIEQRRRLHQQAIAA